MPLLNTLIELIGDTSPVLVYPGLVIILSVGYLFASATYNVFFHPLRKFPGPLLHRASRVPWALSHMRGTKPFHIQKLHEKYGSVVRVAPDFLTFTDPRAWKDIYGHRIGIDANQPEMPKANSFRVRITATNILNADREEHSRLRRALAHGFSDKALREQEPLITRHVDLLIQRLKEYCGGGKKALELQKWYNWTTFDIIGDLVFAQDFGGLSNVAYDPFVEILFKTVRSSALLGALKYLGLDFVIGLGLKMVGAKGFHMIVSSIGAKLKKRMDSKDERPDLIEGLLKRRDEWNLSLPQLRSNSTILTIAGSETTATLLSGATYLLLVHPETKAKLQHEIRSEFKHIDEITLSSVASLPYLLAVLNESLRYYPPVTGGLVRIVPGEGAQIAGHFVAPRTLVEVPQWAMYRSKDHWTDPWTFRPERFMQTSDNKVNEKDNVEIMQAFSYGPRNCIGKNLAISEMRLILARIIFSFDMKLAPEGKDWIERQRSYSIWERPALPVFLTPRDS